MNNYSQMIAQLKSHEPANLLTDQYYEGEQHVPRLNIAQLPMSQIETVVGWPATTVDVLHERTDWLGWDADAKYGLNDVYLENQLDYEHTLGTIDSLLYGVSFGAVSRGDTKAGEPKVLCTIESPKHMTGLYDRRKRRLTVAASRYFNDKSEWLDGALYEEYQTTFFHRETEFSRWRIVKVDKHNLGRVPIVRLPNRGRAGRREGKSEITKAVRSMTNMAVRTLMGMEVNREFFSAPQRYALGAKEDAFVDEDGNPIPGWKAIMGSLWQLQRDEEWAEDHPGDSGLPTVGEFKANPPGPFIEQVKGLSQMFSAEVGIPSSYLGFTDSNPPSADAIRALEARLVKRAERRITGWNPAMVEMGMLAAQLITGDIPAVRDIPTIWRDPATPTSAADADRAVKLVGAEILPKDSGVTYDMVGLSPSQQRRLERDRNKAAFMAILTGGTDDTNTDPQPAANDAGAADNQREDPAGPRPSLVKPAGAQ